VQWDLGSYERVAEQLLPAAEVAVARLAPRSGERVLDLGCGTGNAALLAAQNGARVTGIDPSPRLLGVGRDEAARRRLDVSFIRGDATALPFRDGSVDAIISVFGVIFAPDAAAAAAEMTRVLAPNGRLVLSAWLPGGAIAEQAKVRRDAVAAATNAPPAAPPFDWHDLGAVTELLAPHGFSVEMHDEVLAFTDSSPRSFDENERRNHPMWVAARAVLEPLGRWKAASDEALRVLTEGNEDPAAFRVSSRYVVMTGQKGK